MLRTLKELFEGTSGYEYAFWPARGIPVRKEVSVNGNELEANEYEDEKRRASVSNSDKLSELRRLMKNNHVGIYLVMEQDEHQSEYVADTDRRIRYISDFTGSSAFVSIGMDWAELATDSRYYIIASRQLSSAWGLRKLGRPGVKPWDEAVVDKAIEQGVDIGVDPKFINAGVAEKIAANLARNGRRLVPVAKNLVDEVWGQDKPELSSTKIFSQPIDLTGETARSKLSRCREAMTEKHVNSLIVYALEEIAWLLNLRGGDVPYVPIFKSFLIITSDRTTLYVDKHKLPLDLSNHEGIKVSVKSYDTFFNDIQKVKGPTWVPNSGSWAIFKRVLNKNGNREDALVTDISPINLLRAVKNCAEIAGIKDSQFKCSLSIVRYLSWLGQHVDEEINEYDGGLKLLEIRQQLPDFMGNSFETISAAGPNASSPHYAPTAAESSTIRRDQVYLLDSGSHFPTGSTDITRTVHYGEPIKEEIKAYTLVLKGQLAVASCIFPEGTSGWKLDILARQFLWQENMDYGHGTGHGIGSYLNIHELPLGIGMTNGPESILLPGHFVSDEPGYYKDGEFGVRLESDILVVQHSADPTGRKYLGFEIMTLVPYEPKLIDTSLLTDKEKQTINAYHKKCRIYLGPYLRNDYETTWLNRCTQPI